MDLEKIREQLRQWMAPAQAWFAQLTQRERRLVTGAGVAVGVLIVFLVATSFSRTAKDIRRRTEAKLGKLAEVQLLAVSYREAEAARQDMERQLGRSDVQLISFLEEKSSAVGMEIRSMSPKPNQTLEGDRIIESSVEIVLPDIPVEKLVRFLNSVEQSPGVVKVKQLRIEPRNESQTVASSATVSAYKLKGEAP